MPYLGGVCAVHRHLGFYKVPHALGENSGHRAATWTGLLKPVVFTSARPAPILLPEVLPHIQAHGECHPTLTSVQLVGKRTVVPAESAVTAPTLLAWPSAGRREACLAPCSSRGIWPPTGLSSAMGDHVALILRCLFCRSLTLSEIGKHFRVLYMFNEVTPLSPPKSCHLVVDTVHS